MTTDAEQVQAVANRAARTMDLIRRAEERMGLSQPLEVLLTGIYTVEVQPHPDLVYPAVAVANHSRGRLEPVNDHVVQAIGR